MFSHPVCLEHVAISQHYNREGHGIYIELQEDTTNDTLYASSICYICNLFL